MKYIKGIYVLLLLLVVASMATSCRSKKEAYTHRTKTSVSTSSDDSRNTNAKWKALDIRLTRHDNKTLYRELKQWLGTPYKYAASEKGRGTDCSGMVMEVYKKVYDIKLERNSAKIFEKNCREIGRHRLKEADLVFFNNGKSGRITHVGIYLKEGYFVHASSSRGVIVSHLTEKYYDTHFQCAGRVL